MFLNPARPPSPRGLPRRAAGYALLEALIAVIVTSIGFIGAARLQTLGTSFNSSAGMRQRATLLVDQMTDRMRANHVGMRAKFYDLFAAGDTACLRADTDAAGCTPEALAKADIKEWSDEVAVQLPAGKGFVCIDSTPEDGTAAAPACDGFGLVYAVKVWWSDKLGTNRFVATTRPIS
jgi:type IV pilus assembly protein PilV